MDLMTNSRLAVHTVAGSLGFLLIFCSYTTVMFAFYLRDLLVTRLG